MVYREIVVNAIDDGRYQSADRLTDDRFDFVVEVLAVLVDDPVEVVGQFRISFEDVVENRSNSFYVHVHLVLFEFEVSVSVFHVGRPFPHAIYQNSG